MQNTPVDSTTEIAPGYKQPWLWFVLAPLFAVFIYGFFFLYMAITTSDGIVKEDYYKVARGLEIDTSKENLAKELGITGKMTIDNVTGDIALILSGQLESLPDQLTLDLIHPAHQRYDQSFSLKLQPTTGQYRGSLQTSIAGKRYVALAPSSNAWRLRTELYATVPTKDGKPDYNALGLDTPSIDVSF